MGAEGGVLEVSGRGTFRAKTGWNAGGVWEVSRQARVGAGEGR